MLLVLTAVLCFVALSTSQQCNPTVVEWWPHQYSCQKFVLCFHGNPLEKSCAPGLHFSSTELKCMKPADARCDLNYLCPAVDDEKNPVFLPDRFDCQKYFVCFNGSPIQRSCADNLWWDIVNDWCTTEDEVTCDNRTPNNPGNPTTTTTEGTTVVTDPTEPPILESCLERMHLFDLESGDYLKSSCMVTVNTGYDNAENICRENNMNLFVIENSAVQTPFRMVTTHSLTNWTNGHLWINGRRENTDDWFTLRQTRQALYSGVDWVQTETVDGRTSGDCLTISQFDGPYRAMGRDCGMSSWLSCEFFEQPQLNTEICSQLDAIVDGDGNVLKTSCIVRQSESYWRAEQTCIQNGMKLFVVNNATVETALFELATEVFQPNGLVWINGRREEGEWVAYDHRRVPVFSEIEWVQTESIDGPTNGDCLRFSQQHGPYRAMGDDCAVRTSWFICEY